MPWFLNVPSLPPIPDCFVGAPLPDGDTGGQKAQHHRFVREAIENYYKLAERDAHTDAEIKKTHAPVTENGTATATDTDAASEAEE